MSAHVACPRCGQDWLRHVELVALSRRAIMCPECEALWLNDGDLGGTSWVDFGTFMRQSGRSAPDAPGELRVLDQVER